MARYAIKTPQQHGQWGDFLDVWKAVDRVDMFESAWTMDHFYPLTEPLDGAIHESWTMLGALAQATSRIRLGSMVNGMHFRHPAVTANMACTLDHISGGRFDLGLGAGWFASESEAYGIALGTMKERCDRFDEGVAIVHSLLTQERTSFAGKYYTLRDARCEPKPLQTPRPPIVIGAKGKKRTLRTTARWADVWDVTFPESPGHWSELEQILIGHCEDVGRDHKQITRTIHLGFPGEPDYGEMAAAAPPFFEAGVDVIIYSMRGPYKAAMIDALGEALRG